MDWRVRRARGSDGAPLAVLRWCNAIACHFFYALCFSCVERVERVSRKAASSLFHARENARDPLPPSESKTAKMSARQRSKRVAEQAAAIEAEEAEEIAVA